MQLKLSEGFVCVARFLYIVNRKEEIRRRQCLVKCIECIKQEKTVCRCYFEVLRHELVMANCVSSMTHVIDLSITNRDFKFI